MTLVGVVMGGCMWEGLWELCAFLSILLWT